MILIFLMRLYAKLAKGVARQLRSGFFSREGSKPAGAGRPARQTAGKPKVHVDELL
jgi:hypothetical protein